MKIEVTHESIAQAVLLSWKVANSFERQGDMKVAKRNWQKAAHELDGFWSLVNYARDLSDVEAEEEMLGDIYLLTNIASLRGNDI